MTETEIAWLAGLLEGEGCFRVEASAARLASGRRAMLVVQLRMNDQDVVARAHKLLGGPGSILIEQRANPKHATSYRVKVCGQIAEDVMRRVRPHMGLRRGAKIDEILAMDDLSHHLRRDSV